MLVVQCQLPASLSILWQRLGCGARSPTLQAIGILLAEAKHFDDEKEKKKLAGEARRLKLEVTGKRKRAPSPSQEDSPLTHQHSGMPVPLQRELTPSPETEDSDSNDDQDRPGLGDLSVPTSAPSQIHTPKKPSKGTRRSVEQCVNSFVNALYRPPSDGERRCRREVANKYFQNPPEGTYVLSSDHLSMWNLLHHRY